MIFALLAALRETPWRLGVRLTVFVGLALGVAPQTGFAQKNQFFDGRSFDPDDLEGYLARLPG